MAQARAVKGQIDRLDNQIDIANENYLEARSKHAVLLAQTRAAARREAKAKKRIRVLQRHLGTRASDMYRTGPLGFLDVLLGAKSFDELSTTWDILKDLNRDDSKSIVQMKEAKAEAMAAHKEFATKERASKRQVAIMAGQTASYKRMKADKASKLRGIEAEIRSIEAAEEAAARAAARAQASSGGGGGGGGNWPAPTIPAHGTVVQYARSRLGCPYVWAGSGPRVVRLLRLHDVVLPPDRHLAPALVARADQRRPARLAVEPATWRPRVLRLAHPPRRHVRRRWHDDSRAALRQRREVRACVPRRLRGCLPAVARCLKSVIRSPRRRVRTGAFLCAAP